MNHAYDDILALSLERPKWWDANAVPRFCDFAPDQQANIYCDEAALVLIACQACGCQFEVAFTGDRHNAIAEALQNLGRDATNEQVEQESERLSLAGWIRDGGLHYGDPPSYFSRVAKSKPGAHCCHAGATMNCRDLRVLQYWRRDDKWNWVRNPELEILLPDGRAAIGEPA